MRQYKSSRIMTVVGVTAVLAVLAAGCSSAKKSAAAPAASASAAAGTSAAAAPDGNLTDVPASAPAAPAATSAAPAAAPSAPAAAAGGSRQNVAQPLLTGRQVIYTADITVQTKDIKTAVDQLAQLALGRGGVVFGEQVSLASKDPNNPGTASATVTLKVPPEALNQGGILDQIGRLGTELSRNETASDVTAQVVDVNSRVAAAQDSLARLRQLFSHAGNVADLATVENEIAQREADLESLEAQQRTFATQTAQATITVNLVATPKVAPVIAPAKKAHVVGFVRGLRGGWHAFTRTVTGITTAVGAMLPFLIVLLVLGLAALVVRRRLMTRPSDATTQSPSTGPAA